MGREPWFDALKPWWRMDAVDPGAFALLRVEDAADVLWNLCCAHGLAVDIVRALEARREAEAERTIAAITADLEAANSHPVSTTTAIDSEGEA